MKAKYLILAAFAAFCFASCEKEVENPALNPTGTPVKFTFSAKATSSEEAQLKVTADNPVPADVTINFAVDAASTMKAESMTFPSSVVMAKGESEVTAKLAVDISTLVPGTTTTAKIAASISGVVFGVADAITVKTEPAVEPEPEPSTDSEIVIDGKFDDWAEVTTILEAEDESAPLKVFKVAYDKDYIYFYHKRNNNPAMWGGGYFYLAVDADNNVATGMTEANGNSVMGIEKWMYLYFFLKDEATGDPLIPDAPEGADDAGEYACAAGALAGTYDEIVAETELRIPLADLGITYCSIIKVYTWGNKSASNLKDQPVVVSVGGGEIPPEPEPAGIISIDGDLSDWADFEAVENGNHVVKVAKDDKNLYVYSHRAKDDAFDSLWGSSEAYVYFGLDLDKDATTGSQTLWGNGPYEYVGVIWPYGGSASAPAIATAPQSACAPDAGAIPSLKCNGVIDETGVTIEFSVALSDLPAIPETPFIVNSWGSPALAKVEYHVGEPQPVESPYTDLSTVFALADDADFELTAVTVAAGKNGVVVSDGERGFYLFKPATTPAVGDVITAKGKKTTYYNLVEASQGAEVTVVSSGADVPEIAEIDVTAVFDAYPDDVHASDFISFTGVYQTSGSNVNVTVAGAEKRTGSLQGSVLDAKYDGKTVKVYGYYIGTSGTGGKYFAVIATKIEEVAAVPTGITIDGNFDDWKDIQGVSDGKMGAFKASSDANNIYLYVHRTTEGRYSQLWNADYNSGGYVYFAFNLDGDETTGESLWGNGPYEFIGCIFPWGAESPALSEDLHAACAPSTCSVDNLKLKGLVADDGTHLEFSIPRADLPAIPTTAIAITAWGNKDLTKVTLNCTL